jgi:hypothetical protein
LNSSTNGTVTAADNPSPPRPDNQVIPTPTPTPTPELAKVRLRLITAGGSGCSTYSNMRVTLLTQNRTFKATTDGDGVASFDNVPCGEIARISAPGIQLVMKPGRTFSLSKKLECNGGEIYLGSYSDGTGGQMSEREANVCYK